MNSEPLHPEPLHPAPAVRLATPADEAAVVDTVVAAFDRDPAFRWFFPEPASFDADARVFAAALFRGRCAGGTAWVVDAGDDRAVACALWERPGGSSWQEPDLPPDALRRLQRWDDAVHPLLPAGPHWYLGVLATRPTHGGRALGALAAGPGLALAARAGGAWLETATAANVALYGRRGWTVTGAVDVDGIACTVMHHT